MTFPFKVSIQKINNFFRLIHSTIVFAESFFESSTSLKSILCINMIPRNNESV